MGSLFLLQWIWLEYVKAIQSNCYRRSEPSIFFQTIVVTIKEYTVCTKKWRTVMHTVRRI
ncbi:hypothetical protein B4110_1440 [Parageobacillus toebii]|uniref:Uncharacterized protein n=1 Tax=Parageobacillus toebii TaxID=153151 RepID=A0A150M9L0_9BACL|nr:hypothetical protein B4110_1440 [Parageobacillus toebii]